MMNDIISTIFYCRLGSLTMPSFFSFTDSVHLFILLYLKRLKDLNIVLILLKDYVDRL